MMRGINDELILAARLLLATLFLIFGLRKLRDYSGTGSQMVQLGVSMPALAAAVAIFMEFPVAFAVAVGAFARPSALLMFFLHAENCAYWASLLDNNRCGSSGQHGRLLQKSSHHGRLPAVVHDWCGKIFDRRIVRCRCAMICALLGLRGNVTPRKVGGVV
jgi:DoxX